MTGPSDPRSAADERPYEEAPAEILAALGGTIPTLQQWRAISNPLRPVCIIAGAGSGKTAVIAARVVYLALMATGRAPAPPGEDAGAIGSGVLPSGVLCLTFTNKAAEELARRVRLAIEGLDLSEGEEATVLTYHGFAARILDDHGLRDGIEPGSMLLSEAQKWQLARSLLADRTFESLEVRSIDHVVRLTLALADACANHLVTPEALGRHARELLGRQEVQADREWRQTLERRIELADLVGAYRDRKRDIGAIDYGDQIALAVELATRHPEVGENLRARFGAVLLDEYQDTNVAQARLLRQICPPGYPVTAVGDPDQNIYAWRGASLFNILRFSSDFPDSRSTVLPERPLYVNFRSGSRILAVADQVIGAVPPERRAADKVLRPHPSRGEGRVLCFTAADERAEARRIAALITEFVHGRGPLDSGDPPWQDVAVLCRKRRLFPALSEVLREHGIPVEVVDLGGLLKLPEVVEAVAWLRLLDDPGRNVALSRILQGPRWRIGYRDLAALARWSLAHNRQLAGVLPGEDERPGDVAFALSEALDHLDDEDMTGLSDEARDRLREFTAELGDLRREAHGALGDLVARVIERTGLLRELEAVGGAGAESARRNLLNLIDQVSAFSPVEGQATLSTLVAYLDIAEEADDDLAPAQPSEANTVKLLTIHKAKGLEWPAVFVPGMVEHHRGGSSIFPDVSRQPNPITQPGTLPFELRGDAEVLPRYAGKLSRFRAELTERGLEEERRLAYVAMTRARDLLVVSSAYWYEGPSEPYVPGTFYGEIADRPESDVLPPDPMPDENPLIEIRRRRVGTWPAAARASDVDDLFPEGWHQAAMEAVRDSGSPAARATDLGPGVQASFERTLAEDTERAALIASRTREPVAPSPPDAISVTGLIDYEGCPRHFYWSQVRPLPRRPNPAARLGSEIHQWIERESRGQVMLDLDEPPDLSPDEHLTEPGAEAALKEAFRNSRFAGIPALYVERPFALFLDGVVVRGKIDAIFGAPDGRWEVVDYKTGRVPSSDDPLLGLQLDLYALACTEVWRKRPDELTLTYLYLATGQEVTVPAGDPAATRHRVLLALSAIAEGRFDPRPGPRCRWCDFRAFCPAGEEYVRANPDS